MSETAGSGTAPAAPLLRVVRGTPSAEELAALVTVLAAAGGAAEAGGDDAPVRGGWADRAALPRPLPAPGPGAWRAATR